MLYEVGLIIRNLFIRKQLEVASQPDAVVG